VLSAIDEGDAPGYGLEAYATIGAGILPLQFGHLREFTIFPGLQCTTSGRSGSNHGRLGLPYLSTEAADYVKAIVER
jgi:hypothetical protein